MAVEPPKPELPKPQQPKPEPYYATYTTGNFTDTRDGKKYKTVTIGNQTWMAENLNYPTKGKCYKNSADFCAKYGRLYTWNDAKSACPVGWHLPTDAEWTRLTEAVGGSKTAGKKLKSTSGWKKNGNGTDDFGFSALPGGNGISSVSVGSFYGVGLHGYWWSATGSLVFLRNMNYYFEYIYRADYGETSLYSVRCVQDWQD